MTIATRLSIRHLERLPLGLDYPAMVDRVSDLVSRPELSHCTTLIVDATGVGRPVVDMLRGARLPCRLMPVTITGGASTNGTTFQERSSIVRLLADSQSSHALAKPKEPAGIILLHV